MIDQERVAWVMAGLAARRRRVARGQTVGDLAKRLGCPVQHILAAEEGRRDPAWLEGDAHGADVGD